MKKLIALLFAFVLFAPTVLAESLDISNLTQDELLLLHNQVEIRLREMGYYPYIELANGDKGEDVIALQERLAQLNYYSETVTGKYDGHTKAAIKDFEKANGLKQDGKAAIDEQKLIFSNQAAEKPTPTPKPTKKPTPTPKPKPTPDPRKAYGKFDYSDAARNGDDLRGKKVKITGTVMQVVFGDKSTGFQLLFATKRGYDDLVYIVTPGGIPFNIIEDDKLIMYCRLSGTQSYTTVLGATVTVPAAVPDAIYFQ